ncbi:FecR family protein [Pedobacter metabolipauper]|uniref:FecR family protein n=1 Tax=Pedobacter metabolipauper TaxID=425513 RepID=A0A4R6STI7_9SPHI|nr:FecR domain-containing protein [Pedobacter metabolipauper]TDQ07336.1 FecR family protein [Pedobacter metabolipauper]
MNLQAAREFLILIADNNYTKEQKDAFTAWLVHAPEGEYLEILDEWEKITERNANQVTIDPELVLQIETGLNKIDQSMVPVQAINVPFQSKRKFLFNWTVRQVVGFAAACLMVCSAALLYYNQHHQATRPISAVHAADALPGGNKAVLTLADGSKINLNDISKGVVFNQSGIKIVKGKDGQLIYTATAQSASASETSFNTIETPNGGQYQVELPDGSRVWLNAASSLRYPTVFRGAERKVELTGEGYFEIAKDKTKPFKVITAQQSVEVLGTHFNINSYTDEDHTKTTLLEGSLRVLPSNGNTAFILDPGQQAQVNANTALVKEVDVNDAAGWKDGYFVFNTESIPSVMRKIARWYDIEVVYEGDIKDKELAGSVSRFTRVSEVLRSLELTGLVHFKVEQRKITVIAN